MSVSSKSVGKNIQEALVKGGKEGIATIIAFWMFSNAPQRTFYGGVAVAARQIWGVNTYVEQSLLRYINKRLSANGYQYVGVASMPRWKVPGTWSWDSPEEDDLKGVQINMPAPAPVRTGYLCNACGKKFTNQIEFARHAKEHGKVKYHGKDILQLLRDKGSEGATMQEVADLIQRSKSQASKSLIVLRREGKVQLRDGRYYIKRFVPKQNNQPQPLPPVTPPQQPQDQEVGFMRAPDGTLYRVIRQSDGWERLERV